MLVEKIFRRHKHDKHRIAAVQDNETVTLSVFEGDVETLTMKLPKARELASFAEGLEVIASLRPEMMSGLIYPVCTSRE